jgi:hypothetical protein
MSQIRKSVGVSKCCIVVRDKLVSRGQGEAVRAGHVLCYKPKASAMRCSKGSTSQQCVQDKERRVCVS